MDLPLFNLAAIFGSSSADSLARFTIVTPFRLFWVFGIDYVVILSEGFLDLRILRFPVFLSFRVFFGKYEYKFDRLYVSLIIGFYCVLKNVPLNRGELYEFINVIKKRCSIGIYLSANEKL